VILAPTWTPTAREYHASPGWSASRLAVYRRSPRLARAYWIDGTMEPPGPTPEMELGTAVHALLLGREDEVVRAEGCAARRGKKWAAWVEDYARTHTVLPEPAYEAAVLAADAIAEPQTPAAERARRILLELPGYGEYAYRWEDPYTGVPCKLMADRLVELPGGLVCEVSIKTVGAWGDDPRIDRDSYGQLAGQRGHHCQAAHYVAGLTDLLVDETPAALIIPISTAPPYEVAVYQWNDASLEVGARRVQEALEGIAAGRWLAPHEALEDDIPTLTLPGYMLREPNNA
jgi:hypothetical protein